MPRQIHRFAFSASFVGLASFAAIPLYAADSPLRGNPVDSLPLMQAPPLAPAPEVVAPKPSNNALQAVLAHRITPRNFDVSGVTAIDFQSVIDILEPLAGKNISMAELIQHTDLITKLYTDSGYPLSFAVVQTQDFRDGLIKVTVVEGYIGETRINGDAGPALEKINQYAQRLQAERPLTQATLERYLNLIAGVHGVKVKPELARPRRADGSTELVLNVEHKAARFDAGISNLGTGTHAMLTATGSSMTSLAEQVQVMTTVPRGSDKLEYYAANVAVPIGSDGMSARIDAFSYSAQPESNSLNALNIDREVRTQRVGASLSYPFIVANRESLVGTAGIYASNNRDTYTGRLNGAQVQLSNHLRVVSGQLTYTQKEPQQSRTVSAAIYKGLDSLGASQDAVGGTSRYDLDFTRYTLALTQTVALPYQFGATVAAMGQYSPDSLPTSEQITFGGQRFGKGYPAGELGGDKGWGASLEINRRFLTQLPYLHTVQPYVSYDRAHASLNDSRLRLATDNLASLALGLRVTDQKRYAFDLNLAKPVGDRPVNSSGRPLRFNANYSVRFE